MSYLLAVLLIFAGHHGHHGHHHPPPCSVMFRIGCASINPPPTMVLPPQPRLP